MVMLIRLFKFKIFILFPKSIFNRDQLEQCLHRLIRKEFLKQGELISMNPKDCFESIPS